MTSFAMKSTLVMKIARTNSNVINTILEYCADIIRESHQSLAEVYLDISNLSNLQGIILIENTEDMVYDSYVCSSIVVSYDATAIAYNDRKQREPITTLVFNYDPESLEIIRQTIKNCLQMLQNPC
jgi:hypothetical protein